MLIRYSTYFCFVIIPLDYLILSTSESPIIIAICTAKTDERQATDELLDRLSGLDLFADNGFLGKAWQRQTHQHTVNQVWTPKRKKQYLQPTAAFQAWLNRFRLHIEGLFNEIQNVSKNVYRFLAKTVRGLSSRIVAKLTSHLLKYILRNNFGIDVLSLSKVYV